MPNYVYQCACGHSMEVFHEMSAAIAITCPECMKEMVRKPGISGVSFKGMGWGRD